MNNCITIYRQVNEFFKSLYPVELKGNLRRNMSTMAAMITGIIIGRETQLPKIALNVPEPIKVPSTEKRLKRLLINENITEQTYFLPFIQALLERLDLREIVLAIDGSIVGRGCICLMITLLYKGRAIPLVFSVVRGKKGHLPEDSHIALINKLRPLIPKSTTEVIFVGDGEFDGTSLQHTMNSCGWKYVCRTSSNITIYIGDEPFQMDILASMLVPGCYDRIHNCRMTHKNYGPVTLIAWWGEGHEEPIFLVANFKSASKACEYYEMRFTIETFFSDQKSRGFHIAKSHLSSPERLTRLMYASCLAYVWVIFFGVIAIETGLYKQIHRTDRCDLSLFQIGLRFLTYLAVRGLPMPSYKVLTGGDSSP